MKKTMCIVATFVVGFCALLAVYVVAYNSHGRFVDRFSLAAEFYRPARMVDRAIALKKLRNELVGNWVGEFNRSIVVGIDGDMLSVLDVPSESVVIDEHFNLVGRNSVSVADDKMSYLLKMRGGKLYVYTNDVYSGREIEPVIEFQRIAK